MGLNILNIESRQSKVVYLSDECCVRTAWFLHEPFNTPVLIMQEGFKDLKLYNNNNKYVWACAHMYIKIIREHF